MPRRSFLSASFGRARPAALFLAAAMLLSGCQSGGSPTATSSTTATPTPSASSPVAAATPAASAAYKPADAKGKAQNVPVPVMSELAKSNSKAGLEAFIGYWYATYSYAIETGDLTAWRAITNTSTPVAVAHEESVELNYINGRWMVGGRLATPVVEVTWEPQGGPVYSTKVQVIQEAIQYYDAEGVEGQPNSAATNTADAVLATYVDGAWKVTEYGSIVG
ncbi:hypothetical protein FQP90_15370 [Paenarthrobacter nitroguajacolicus]|uniref:DUF6318 domain-containing protein n=1 Tax=Paenarthrobacter nitroguajacolicus TaxID=211146 RepID=A0A558GVN1_PAENT|nr:DUF6318 family protein [Paenarthrobacter nitroguajacolicus]TVU60935.1 hypothetical protein FQP90_15370 [Paenarthrobacter nitroguajacolicus]